MRRIIACLLQIAGELMTEFLDSMKIWLPGALVMLTLILCSGFFSASETAFFFLTREQIRRFGQGNLRQRTVAGLLANPDRLLTAVLFWNLVINLGYFSVGIVVMQQLTAKSFHMVAACLAVFNLVGMIVFGEVLPKSLAVVFRQQISSLAGLPLAAAVRILDPFIPTLDRIARVLRRSFWPQVKHEAHLQAKDLEKAIVNGKNGKLGQIQSVSGNPNVIVLTDANDVGNFRQNIENDFLPFFTDITYEGLFFDYFFDIRF